MNSLSWFLYLCDILNNMKIACAIILSCGTVVGGIITALLWGYWSDYPDNPKPIKFTIWLLSLIVFTSVLACLIPSRQTMYMIAASETVQRVALNSPEGQEVIELIHKRLLEVLKDDDSDKK